MHLIVRQSLFVIVVFFFAIICHAKTGFINATTTRATTLSTDAAKVKCFDDNDDDDNAAGDDDMRQCRSCLMLRTGQGHLRQCFESNCINSTALQSAVHDCARRTGGRCALVSCCLDDWCNVASKAAATGGRLQPGTSVWLLWETGCVSNWFKLATITTPIGITIPTMTTTTTTTTMMTTAFLTIHQSTT